LVDESFNQPLLEYPQYTEPYDYDGRESPRYSLFRQSRSDREVAAEAIAGLDPKQYRPDLFKQLTLDKKDLKLLKELESGDTPTGKIGSMLPKDFSGKPSAKKAHKFHTKKAKAR
jgi:tRNA G37 N-methylase TrmD